MGNIYAQANDGETIQITYDGNNSEPILSKQRDFVVYVKSNEKDDIEEGGCYPTQICIYYFGTLSPIVLVQGCDSERNGGSYISYANSEKYPFGGLCNVGGIFLSPDDKTIYFGTSAWAVSGAVHYCIIATKQIYFITDGYINKVYPTGNLNISTSRIQKGGGRIWEDWLFDKNGKKIKFLKLSDMQ